MKPKTFQSISSDNNLFDYDHLVRVMVKEMGMTFEEHTNRITAHLRKKHPEAPEYLLSALMAAFITAEMTPGHFMEMMDALGCAVSITITPPILAGDRPESKTTSADTVPKVFSYPALWDESIDVLDLPLRATNVLRHLGEIEFVGQLVRKKPEDLMKIRSFGNVLLQHVHTALREQGLKFATDTTGWMSPAARAAVAKWQHESIVKFNLGGDIIAVLRKEGVESIGQLLCYSWPDLEKLSLDGSQIHQISQLLQRHDMLLGLLKYAQTPILEYKTEFKTYPPSWNKTVYELDLSARWQNVLWANNIYYLGQLTKLEEKEVMLWQNMGSVGLSRLKEAMKKHGLVFGQDTGNWQVPAPR